MHFRSYGDIEKLELKVDPSTGASLGLCSIRYRESKSDKSHAHECAKRATKEGNGSKIGMNEMKVEFDRDGQVCKKIMERLLAEKRKAQEVLQRKAMMVRHQVQNRDSRFRDRDDWSTFGYSPESRAGARSPHGRALTPGHTSEMRSPSREDKRTSPLPQRDGWVPNALDRIKQEPYIHIPASAIPPEEKFIPHLKGKLKKYEWTRIYVDRCGFYIVFKDGREADRCYRQSKEDTFFTFIMVMHFFPLGNPNNSSEDQDRCTVSEIKKYRQVDIVTEVTDGLIKEMSLALMKDIKRRIAAPAFYDFLNPTQFKKVSEKGGSPEPAPATKDDDKLPRLGVPVKEYKPSTASKPTASSAAVKLATLPRFKKRVVVTSSSGLTASLALNDSGKKLVKTDARPLHHQLNNYHSDVGSDDESSTLDQRPVSRGFSTADDDSMVTTPQAGSVVIGKRKRSGQCSSRLRDTPFSSEDEDEKKDSDRKTIDDDDLLSVADAVMPDANDLDDIDAFLLVSQAKEASKTSSAAKKRLRELDFTSSEDESDNEIGKGVGMPNPTQEVKSRTELRLPEDEDTVMSGTRLEKRPAKLAKKAACKAGRQPKQHTAKVVTKEKKSSSSTKRGRVTELLQWAIPTPGESQPTIMDDSSIILDLDGWQDLVKDDEDFECLRIALEGTKKADIGNTAVWAYNQKEVKASNSDGLRGSFLPLS